MSLTNKYILAFHYSPKFVQTIGGPPLCRDGCRNEVCDDVSRRLAASEYYKTFLVLRQFLQCLLPYMMYLLRSRTVLSFTVYPNMTNPGVAPSFRRNGVKLGTFYINPVRSPRLLFEGNITALLFRVEDADNPGIVSYHLPLTVRSVNTSFLIMSQILPPFSLSLSPSLPPSLSHLTIQGKRSN